MGIPVLEWIPYSPDLNLIVHIWRHLIGKVLKLFLELKDMATGEETGEALERALE